MIVLGIDSSSKSASAALIKDGKVLCENYLNLGLTHSQTLMVLVDNCFKNNSIEISDVDIVAVSNGPGSFTGVRIGLSCAKGIAFTSDIKCCPVSTLEALAVNAKHFTGKIYSVLDARCSQVYFAEFKSGRDGILRLCDDTALTLDEVKSKVLCEKDDVILVGDGAELTFDYLKDKCDNVVLSDENMRYTSAASVAMLADLNNAIDAQNLIPNYLRLPQAERNLKKENSK